MLQLFDGQSESASERRYRTIVDNVQEGIWQIDAEGRTNFVNPRMAAMLGCSVEECVGASIFDFMDDQRRLEAEKNMAKRRAGITEQHEFQFRRRDGSTLYALLSTNPLIDDKGKFVGALAMVVDVGARIAADRALKESEARFARAQSIANLGCWEWDLSTGDVTLSPESYRLLDIPATTPPNDILGKVVERAHPEDRKRLTMDIQTAQLDGTLQPGEYRFVQSDGSVRYIWAEGELSPPQAGQGQKLFGTIQDITARKQTQAALANSERKWRAIFNQTFQFIGLLDPKGILLEANETALQFARTTAAEVLGLPFWETPWWSHSRELQDRLKQTIVRSARGELVRIEVAHPDENGTLHAIDFSLKPIFDEQNQVYAMIAEGRDITERIQTQERLRFMAQHDALTGLPNRLLLLDRLKQALARAHWRKRLVAVMFVDLDRFKNINDSLGHDAGDRLLQQLGERFRHCVRDGDTVARFGGDEFVILLDDIASESDITAIAQKVLEALQPSFAVDKQSLYISASIGISLFPNDGDDSSTLLKHADMAMYRAKEAGKNTYQFFAAEMSSRAFERLSLETSLRKALERAELLLHYQPQIDVETGAIVGVEALVRWQHPEFGMVLPNEFIAIAEETGLISLIGQWVLQSACAQLARWRKDGWTQLRLSVNLSPRQFQVPGLIGTIKQALDATAIDPDQLELEITEGILVSHTPAMLEALEALRALNVRLAIDDFGTGYSSLSYLRRFPIDTLKIDRSFVHDIPRDADDSAIVAAIIALAKSLKLEIVAEGVERAAQRDLLRGLGCRIMQGYFFSRPLSAEDMTKLLHEQRSKTRRELTIAADLSSQG